jgi:isopenicillin-N N-acyltransferase-like protein
MRRRVTLERVTVEGDAWHRGHQYGAGARPKILASIGHYRRLFADIGGLDWRDARRVAMAQLGTVRSLLPEIDRELRGIAAGARVDVDDIVALNWRTELLCHARELGGHLVMSECSVVGIAPDVSADGRLLVGQNWDWLPFARDTLIELEVRPNDGPAFLTIVEAGLMAKLGMNEAGLAILTNGLMTDRDRGASGIPYHVILRGLMGCETPEEGIELLRDMPRASSANYVLAAGQRAVDVEAMPGGRADLHERWLTSGSLQHTNHTLWGSAEDAAVSASVAPSSVARLGVLRSRLDARSATDRAFLEDVLADHENRPLAVCAHEDESAPWFDRWATVASALMSPSSREMWVAPGNPCTTEFTGITSSVLTGA